MHKLKKKTILKANTFHMPIGFYDCYIIILMIRVLSCDKTPDSFIRGEQQRIKEQHRRLFPTPDMRKKSYESGKLSSWPAR